MTFLQNLTIGLNQIEDGGSFCMYNELHHINKTMKNSLMLFWKLIVRMCLWKNVFLGFMCLGSNEFLCYTIYF